MCTPRLVDTKSPKVFGASAKTASSNMASFCPRPIQPKSPESVPGCAALWQSESSRHIRRKTLGSLPALSNFSSASKAANSASCAVFAAPCLRAMGSAWRNCWWAKRMCRTRTVPSAPVAALTFCRFAAGSSPRVVSVKMHKALLHAAFSEASAHQRKAEALGCLVRCAVEDVSLSSGKAAVAPHNKATRCLPFGRMREAVSGFMSTNGCGARKSRQPMARLDARPSRISASCRASPSAEKGRRSVVTASRQ
mmetsp:Transcript_101353/g.293113  ORF Transcript_101353/g.293113 Transcript_101353/m.293113 type:complete len:252 (+) Transcript_101353:97-852(+)